MFKIFIVLFTLSLSIFVECKLYMYCHVEFLNVYTPYCKKTDKPMDTKMILNYKSSFSVDTKSIYLFVHVLFELVCILYK